MSLSFSLRVMERSFRVDELEGITRQGIVEFLTKHTGRHVVCREISEKTKKPHYQGWVEHSTDIQTFRLALKKAFPVLASTKRGGDGSYSLAVIKKKEYKRYILKGTPEQRPDIVSMQLAPNEAIDVDREHAEYWRVNKESKQKENKAHWIHDAVKYFEHYEFIDDASKRRIVAEYVVDYQLTEKISLDVFRTRSYVNYICSRIDKDFKEDFICEVINRV